MARPIWKGQISFGLVNVPVTLYSAEQRADLSFKLLDSRNSARVRYERVNEETGEEVPWDKIVKGFEYDGGHYVLLSDDELQNAAVELTRTVEIEQFVDLEQIDVVYFDRPYYLVPAKGGTKGYVILREAMRTAGKVGLAQVVIRTRQSLCALMPVGDALVLNLLRYHQELRDISDYDIPGSDMREVKISKKEIDMATQLLESMTEDWEPASFKNEYYAAVMKLVETKIKSGKTEVIESELEEEEDSETQTINFMDVLKKSVKQSASRKKSPQKTPRKKAASRKAANARKSTRKKKTG